jgi:exopolysaccharide biosynthesis polyprenyl glycosylphosphotransferase
MRSEKAVAEEFSPLLSAFPGTEVVASPYGGASRPHGRIRADSQSRYLNYRTLLAMTLDCLSVVTGIAAGVIVYQIVRRTNLSSQTLNLFVFSIQYSVAFILFGRLHSLYSHSHSLLKVRETAGILRVSVFSLASLSVGLLLTKLVLPRLLLVISWVFITFFLLLQRHVAGRMLAKNKAKHRETCRVLILGAGSQARRLFSFLTNSPNLQLDPVAFFQEQGADDDSRVIYSHDYQFKDCAPVYGGRVDRSLLERLEISDIFVADPDLSTHRLGEIAALAQEKGINLSFVGSALPYKSGHLTSVREMDGLLVSLFTSDIPKRELGYETLKRMSDIVLASLMILASAPLWAVIAAWIKLSSEGPVFFKQTRVGRGGKPFEMYKFRSMYITASKYERSPEDSRDPRITPAGRFLRKTSLDELPQLVNVLTGDMTMVGPRPEMPYVVEQYDSYQAQRLLVPQGLTGIWQLSADRKFAIHESIEYDLYYLENRGVFLDIAILVHTLAFAMKGI